nr:reverse transcriptase domain-containing protein [Tanacetum cinerariifolium]
MQTRSSSKFVSGSSSNPISTNSKHHNRIRSKPRVEPFSISMVTMADNRMMEEMLQAPTEDLKAITTRSGVTLAGPLVSSPSKEVDREPKMITDQELTRSANNVPPLVVQPSPVSTSFSTISSKVPEPKPTIPYPSRANKQKRREKYDILALKFVEIFRNLHIELSFADAFLHMPKFSLMFKSLLNNKEKLFDLATTPMNENCSVVILKKLPLKLGDPDKFFIPCNFPELDECLALADLDASINLMCLSI